ncbi:hypothetical protein PG993_010851 [Apiospora rasikravindrae]|uniref:F-box domain-containing protein n=1 Tax=Apiospora rasikravindrae TaxID=990691 RepID=A0ABR1SCM2_9PEZI
MAHSGLDFPPEIINLICDLLFEAELHALCGVNRRLRAVAEPRLYSELRWKWNFTWPEAPPRPYPMNTRVPPLIPFLRAVARRPELGAYVRTIGLECGEFDSYDATVHYRDTPALPVVGADLTDLVARVQSFNVPYADQWVQKLQRGRVVAFVALLLALTPNLQHLRIDEEYLPDKYIGLVLVKACMDQTVPGKGDPPNFDERLSLTSSMVDLLSLFYLPAAKGLPFSDGTAAPDWWPAAHQASPKDLISLDLTMRHEGYARRILSTTKNLKKLRWRWPGKPVYNEVTGEMVLYLHPYTASQCVSHIRRSLTDLAITIAHTELQLGHHYDTVQVQGTLSELARFPNLKTLEVPLIFLTTFFTPHVGLESPQLIAKCLPPSLESLTMLDTASFGPEWDDSPDSPFDPVEKWLAGSKSTTPCLSRVRFELRETARQDWGPTLADNSDEDLSARYGLNFKVARR